LDLNLDSPSASAELEKRISDAAVDVCKRLDERFPDSRPKGRACAEIAVKDALRKVHASEMAARRKART
jgi:UrcA family protein